MKDRVGTKCGLLYCSAILLLALGLALAPAPALAQEDEGQENEELSAALSEMAELTQVIADAYPQAVADGEVVDEQAFEQALESARQIAAAFGGAGEDTDFEEQLQEISLPLGEQIEGQVARLARQIEDRRPADEVQALLDELAPNFNRAVLLAKGQVAPLEGRQLKTEQAIQDAVAEIGALVDEAVAAYGNGETEEAGNLANEAFFLFESNGIGTDATLVDEELENRVESGITNFANPEEDPGLEQLIANGVPLEQIEEQAAEIQEGLAVIASLLTGTLPDVLGGDVNGDGRVTIVDALFIARAVVNLENVDLDAADVNGDGNVSIVDALQAAQIAIGLRPAP